MKKYLLGSAFVALGLGFITSSATANGAPAANAGPVSDVFRVTKPELKITGEAMGVWHWFENSHPRGEKGLGTQFAIEDSQLTFQAIGRMDVWDHMFYDWLVAITGDTNETK